jgi:hypothetical protein
MRKMEVFGLRDGRKEAQKAQREGRELNTSELPGRHEEIG